MSKRKIMELESMSEGEIIELESMSKRKNIELQSGWEFMQKGIMSERKYIELESGWEFMQKGITKLKNILEGIPEQQFNSEEYIMLYTTIYNMCTQKPPQDYSQQLYDRYRESFEEYITSMMESSAEQRKVIPEYNQ